MRRDMTPGGYGQPQTRAQWQQAQWQQAPQPQAQWQQAPQPQAQWQQAPQPLGPPIRATDRDRDVAIEVVQASYTEGRLTRDEHDTRIGQVLSAQTYTQLDMLIADLPGRPRYPDAPAVPAVPQHRPTNGLAVAALVCGVAQPLTGMLTTIPAIVLGHAARGQIRSRGDDGESLATWGLMLGWAGLATVLVFVLGIVAIVVLLSGAGP
jgi:Domain of unknown function (DUF1707)/Domain of unknown function (DUF4190)